MIARRLVIGLGLLACLPSVRALDIAAAVNQDGVWCSHFLASENTCTHVLHFQSGSEGLQLSMTWLQPRGSYAMKATVHAVATVRGGTLCLQPREVAHSMQLYYTGDASPSITPIDQPAEPALADRAKHNRHTQRLLGRLPAEVCGRGPFVQPLTLFSHDAARILTLRPAE